jgi:hypothetical protein
VPVDDIIVWQEIEIFGLFSNKEKKTSFKLTFQLDTFANYHLLASS